MILTTKARYSVMATIEMSRGEEGKPISLKEIAERQDISLSYLEQIFAKLKKGGIVTSVKGPGGGYMLSRSNKQINIFDIIKTADEPIRITRCEGKKNCGKHQTTCQTHHLWNGLENKINGYLKSISLADL